MYERFYGLTERPFDLTANPRFLFLSPKHEEALSVLLYALRAQKGVTALIGEAGTGKTTILRAALESGRVAECRAVYLCNPSLSRAEFFEWLSDAFALPPEAGSSKARFLRSVETVLLDRQRNGLTTAIVIDEAQSLPDDLLEELRLLANMETATRKLLSLVLTGQPELATRLNRASLRQLKQRIALRCVLEPLELNETAEYIATRLRVAGGDCAQVFAPEAVTAIHRLAKGIPRTISVISDNALLTGFALNRRPVDAAIVLDACRDLDVDRLAPEPDPAEAPIAAPVAIAPLAAGSDAAAAAESRSAFDAVPEVALWAKPTLFAHFSARRRFSFFSPRVEPQ